MKRLCISTSILVLGLLISSCAKDDTIQNSINEGNTVTSLEDTEISCTGGSFSLAFTSNVSWTLKNCPKWLNVSKASGKKGTTVIEMSADVNATRKDRVANLVFSATDGSFETPFNVSQTFPYLNVSRDSLSFDWNNARTDRGEIEVNTNTAKIAISSNIHWMISPIGSTKAAGIDISEHFAISTEEGVNNSDVEFIPIKDNFSKEPYEFQLLLRPVMEDAKGNIVDIPAEAADSYTIKLHQKNLRFLINGSTDDASIEFSEINDNKDINYIIDCEIPWKVSQKPDWVVLDKEQGGENVTVNFLADKANPDKKIRSGKIRLMTDAGAYREIAVSQRAYIFDIDKNSFNIENDDTTEKTVKLNTTGTWEVINIPDWLNVEPTSGSDTTGIRISAKGQNLNFYDNSQLFIIKSTMNDLSESVSVKQDKFIFEVTPDDNLVKLGTMSTKKYSVAIKSSGKWRIDNTVDWIDIDTRSGEKGDATIMIGPNSGNPNIYLDREVELKLVSINHEDANQTKELPITVKQRKYTFDVSEDSFGTIEAYKPKSKQATIDCSSNWEIVSYPEWVEIPENQLSGDGGEKVTIDFSFKDNTTKTPINDDKIIINSWCGEKVNNTHTISVSQDAFVFDNEAEDFTSVPVMNTANYKVSFNLTDKARWSIEKCDVWLCPDSENGTGSSTVTFTPDPNPDLAPRTGKAIIYSEANGERKTITFTQEKYVFDSDPESYAFTELATTVTPITVTSSGDWEITDAPSWIKLSKSSASTSENISFSPLKNTSRMARTATFHIVSTLNKLHKGITVSQDAFEFDDTEESFAYTTLEERTDPVSILCSGKWTAKGVPAWVTLSSTTGNGNQSGIADNITIKSTKNLTEEDKNATISIVSDDNPAFVKTITLHQDKFDFRVSKKAITYTSPLDVTSRSFDITCPAEWTASSDKNWVALSTTAGMSDGSITLTPEENLTTEKRIATITVRSILNGLERNVTVSQPAFEFKLDKSSHTFTSPIGSDNSNLTVAVNCSAGWTVASEADWLSISKTGSNGDGTIVITPSTNISKERRTAKVIVTSTRNGLQETVDVEQAEYEFDDKTEDVSIDACPAVAVTKDIVCSGNWTVNSTQTWVVATPSVTKGNGTISIQAQDNPYESERTATITVTSVENPSFKKVFNITQKPHKLDLSEESLTFDSYSDRRHRVRVTTSGPWTVSSNQGWLTVNPSTTSGDGDIDIDVAINSSLMPRYATITVKCSNTTLQKTISVTQRAYEFDTSTESIHFEACPGADITKDIICSGSWTAVSTEHWVTAESGNGTIIFKAESNPTDTERTATVTVTSNENSALKKVFNISQSGHQMAVSSSTLDFESYPVASKTVNVTTTGPWTAGSSASWLTISQTAASGNGSVTITAAVNGNLTPRTAIVTIKCEKSALQKTVTVNQGAYEFDSAPVSLTIEAAGSSQTKTITCSGKWTVSTVGDWITVTTSEGIGNGSITIAVASNPGAVERTGQVTITSSDNTSLKKVFTITQKAQTTE